MEKGEEHLKSFVWCACVCVRVCVHVRVRVHVYVWCVHVCVCMYVHNCAWLHCLIREWSNIMICVFVLIGRSSLSLRLLEMGGRYGNFPISILRPVSIVDWACVKAGLPDQQKYEQKKTNNKFSNCMLNTLLVSEDFRYYLLWCVSWVLVLPVSVVSKQPQARLPLLRLAAAPNQGLDQVVLQYTTQSSLSSQAWDSRL